jgi:hypothetical protein
MVGGQLEPTIEGLADADVRTTNRPIVDLVHEVGEGRLSGTLGSPDGAAALATLACQRVSPGVDDHLPDAV